MNPASVVTGTVAAVFIRVYSGSDLLAASIGLASICGAFLLFWSYYFVRNLRGWNRLFAPNYSRLTPHRILFAIHPRNMDSWISVPREGTSCEVRTPDRGTFTAQFLVHTTNPSYGFEYPQQFGAPADVVPSGTYRTTWRRLTKRGKWREMFRYEAHISDLPP